MIPKTATIIIGSGQCSPSVLHRIRAHRANYTVICADGGANYAMAHSLIPDYLIGDFDSITPEALRWVKDTDATVTEYPANKDASDMELAIDLARTLPNQKIVLTSILGLRFDHTMANILFLASDRYKGINISIHEDSLIVSPLRNESLSFTGKRGDTFSIIPVSSTITGVTITGAEWDLMEATIPIGSTWSLSNRFKSETVTATLREGTALFLHLVNDAASIS